MEEVCVFPKKPREFRFSKGDAVCVKDEGTKKGTYRGERIHREPMDYVDRRDITVELEEGGIQIYDEALVGRIEMKPAKPGGRRKTKQRKIKRKRTRRATR